MPGDAGSDATRVGEDGREGDLHRGACKRGGSGPTAVYHYKKSRIFNSLGEPQRRRESRHLPHDIPRTHRRSARVDGAAHARLRQMQTPHQRSPRDQSRTLHSMLVARARRSAYACSAKYELGVLMQTQGRAPRCVGDVSSAGVSETRLGAGEWGHMERAKAFSRARVGRAWRVARR